MPNDERTPTEQPFDPQTTPQENTSWNQPQQETPAAEVSESTSQFSSSSHAEPSLQEGGVGSSSLENADSQPEVATQQPPVTSPEPLSTQPAEPVPNTTAEPLVPVNGGDVSPKKSKLKLVLLIVLPILLLGLIGAGAYAYTVYQKPENVVLSAITKAMDSNHLRTETTVTSDFAYDVDGTKVSFDKLTLTTGYESAPQYDTNAELLVKYNDKQVSLKADALLVSEGAVYFRVSNLKDTLQKVLPAEMKITAKADEYLTKFDGKWAKYSLEDLKKDNPDTEKIARCTLDVYKKNKDDKKAQKEVADLYKAHPFITINGKPTSKDGNLGYEVDIDKTKSKAFGKALKDTTIAKELAACDSDNSTVDDTIDSSIDKVDTPVSPDEPKTVVTLWISQWGHEVKAIDTKTTNLSGPEGKKFTISSHTKVDLKHGVETQVPADAMTFKDWNDAVTGAYTEPVGGAQISSN